MTENDDPYYLESLSENDFLLDSKEELLCRLIPDNTNSILEVGCGRGSLSKKLNKHYIVWASDIDRNRVESLKNLGLDAIVLNIETDKISQKFDLIIASEVLEHIDHEKALKNIIDLLNPRGFLILTVPAHPSLYNLWDKKYGHKRRYSMEDLSTVLIDHRFKIIYKRWWNFIGLLIIILFKLLNKEYPWRTVSNRKICNRLLRFWFLMIENRITPPIGGTIIVVAQKS